MKRCSICGKTYADELLFCPDCGVKLEYAQTESISVTKPVRKPKQHSRSRWLIIFLTVALVAAVIAAIYFYNEADSYSWRLWTAQSNLRDAQNELDKVSDLLDVYGYASSKFYSKKSVLVLKKSETKDFKIYASMDTTYYISSSNRNAVVGEWSREWSGSTTTVHVTGISTGYYTLEFTNAANSDSFEVLIIVTD